MVLPVATFECPHTSLVCEQQVVRDRSARAAITRGIGSPTRDKPRTLSCPHWYVTRPALVLCTCRPGAPRPDASRACAPDSPESVISSRLTAFTRVH